MERVKVSVLDGIAYEDPETNSNMNVQILSKKLITPSSPTPSHFRNHKVSWLSMFQSPLIYLPNIFYYPSSTGGDNIERRGELETELRNRLAPIPHQPADGPIVLVQFNMFDCGAVAIGVCIKHRAADATSVFAFINAWATAARLGVDKVEIQKRFVFNGAAISKLKAVASANIHGSHQPTRVEVVTALMWKALTMVARAKHGRLRPSLLVHSFNLRGKIGMPVPDNSFGNFTNPALARFTADDDENKVELDHFVDRVHDGIRKRVEFTME
ncbi:F21J9.9 [Salix purpurea]|uniref:F21J9.9 n=1 Tax=Salix purpurea TaxID=77065 RepID=A0A9Q0W5R7_SALPP|nr:F21J9.9 [Salix purpurea]